jgi:hypothetical protein
MRFFTLFLTLLLALSLGTALSEAAKKKKPAPPPVPKELWNAPMTVVIVRHDQGSCEPNCPEWISAEGEITAATPAQFRKVFKQMGKKKLPILLQSPGGSIEAALEVGKMIRDRKLDVAIGFTRYTSCTPIDKACKLPKDHKGIYRGSVDDNRAFCNSACPLILAGGVNRTVGYFAGVGVHEPRTTWTRDYVRYREFYKIVRGKKKVTQRKIISRKTKFVKETYGVYKGLRLKLVAYFKTMDINAGIIDDMSKASYKDMHWLPDARMDELRIRTASMSATAVINPNFCRRSDKPTYCIIDKTFDPAVIATRQREFLGIKADMPAMTFRLAQLDDPACGSNCPTWIAADGVITESTPQMFRVFSLQYADLNSPVVFNSPGGDAKGAIKLGRAIREAKLHTSVGATVFKTTAESVAPPAVATVKAESQCDGACVFAFAGGIERHSNTSQRATLHRPDAYDSRPAVIIDLNEYLRGMGVSQKLMTDLHTLGADEKRKLSQAELLQLAVTTDAIGIGNFLSSQRCKTSQYTPGCNTPKLRERKAPEVAVTIQRKQSAEKPMRPVVAIANTPDCTLSCPIWIYAEGEITDETEVAFRAIFKEYGFRQPPVVLNSRGGKADVAMSLGRMFRDRKLKIAVGTNWFAECPSGQSCPALNDKKPHAAHISGKGTCIGACVLALAGGARRMVDNDADVALVDLATLFSFGGATVSGDDINFFLSAHGIASPAYQAIKSLMPGEVLPIWQNPKVVAAIRTSGLLRQMISRVSLCRTAVKANNCVSVR